MAGHRAAMEKAMSGLSKAELNIFRWPRRSAVVADRRPYRGTAWFAKTVITNPVVLVSTCLLVSLAACDASSHQQIVGKWQAGGAIKVTAEFDRYGVAQLTIFGQTVRGRYAWVGDNVLQCTLNGITTRYRIRVSATELELTDERNQTIVYERR